jgi:hypothetical protein
MSSIEPNFMTGDTCTNAYFYFFYPLVSSLRSLLVIILILCCLLNITLVRFLLFLVANSMSLVTYPVNLLRLINVSAQWVEQLAHPFGEVQGIA